VKQRKTDYGTIILHWLLVAAFGVAFVSGLRIATEAPGRGWINVFDAVLPRQSVWVAHMQAAVVLVTHNRQLAQRADRILLLEDGRLRPVAGVEALP